jgi:hypothetical protein
LGKLVLELKFKIKSKNAGFSKTKIKKTRQMNMARIVHCVNYTKGLKIKNHGPFLFIFEK